MNAIVPTEAPPINGVYVLYRLVPSSVARVEDFRTQQQLGLPEPAAALGVEARWSRQFGVSPYAARGRARRRALASRGGPRPLGQFVAELQIVDLGAPILIVKTGGSTHFDLVADPQFLLAAVVTCVGL